MSDKVKVLHFELNFQVGGIEAFLYNLYSEIDRSQFQFDFVTRYEDTAIGRELENLGARIYKVASYENPIKYLKDIEKLLKNHYDIVHIHKNSAANILPFIITSRHPETKVFCHSHNTAPSIGKASCVFHMLNKKYLWKHSEIHLACSEAAGNWLYKGHSEFSVVSNGIDVSRYLFDESKRKAVRDELGIPEDAIVVGHVGRFAHQKNHKKLIHIFGEILKLNLKSKLLLVGEGDLKKPIEDSVKESELKESVIFTGLRKDVPELMMSMDVFVMPSFYEGLPIVGIEAQATGLTVFLADTITTEIEITKLVHWFSLEDTDEKIAKKILSVLDDCFCSRTKSNEVISENGYSIKDSVRQIEFLYKRCMAELKDTRCGKHMVNNKSK